MTRLDLTDLAPLEYVVVDVIDDRDFPLEAIRELRALASAEIARVVDVLVVRPLGGGYVELEVAALPAEHPLAALGSGLASMLTHDDIDQLVQTVAAGHCAVLFVLEQCWAAELDAALSDVGASVPARGPMHRDAWARSVQSTDLPTRFLDRRGGAPAVIEGPVRSTADSGPVAVSQPGVRRRSESIDRLN